METNPRRRSEAGAPACLRTAAARDAEGRGGVHRSALREAGRIDEKGYGDISFFTTWTDDKLRGVWLALRSEADQKRARDEATKLWGDPVEGAYLGHPVVG